jgi:hypothetical protein
MPSQRIVSLAVVSLALLAAPGCSCATSTTTPDAAADAPPILDTGHALDTGTDAATTDDAGTDAGGGSDAGPMPVDAFGPDSGRHCTPTTDCGFGFYCHTVDGMCDGDGVCEETTEDAYCPGAAIVCGCDGVDYINRCAAARAGMAIDHDGACDGGSGCTSDADCPLRPGPGGTRFCQFADGACGGVGVCTSRLIGFLCSLNCVPQCGCNGMSYRNACTRQQAGVSLQSRDNCPVGPPACAEGGGCCTGGGTCTVGQECVPTTDTTATGATCEPIPVAPDCWVDADCGSSGSTCSGAFVCPCGMSCPRPDATGTCS